MKLKKKKLLNIFSDAEKKAKKFKFFQKSSQCLIGLSGGQDSISLAIFMRSLQRKWDLKCDFVYCHHAWQRENFYTLKEIIQYASYTEYGCFVFLNPKNCLYYKSSIVK